MSIREQQKQQRRQHIIQAAKHLFLEHGVQTVQMNDVAKAADIGIATLFRYFPKKEYLMIATTNAIIEEMAAHIEQILNQPTSAYIKIEHILDYYLDMTKDPHLRLAKYFESFDLYERIAEGPPEHYTDYLNSRRQFTHILLNLAEQGQHDGSLKSGVDLDLFVMTMVQNFSQFTFKSSLMKHDDQLSTLLSAEKQLTMMKDIFLSYIKP